jgi:hypothetical protein
MKGGERKRVTHEQNLELAEGKGKVIILFDEMVRPAPTSEIAPDKLKEFGKCGARRLQPPPPLPIKVNASLSFRPLKVTWEPFSLERYLQSFR